MNIRQIIENYYQTLKTSDDNGNYDATGMRSKIATEAANLLVVFDRKTREDLDIDSEIFSFVSFLGGYDLPRSEDNGYLFSIDDLEREYEALGDIGALTGSEIEIY